MLNVIIVNDFAHVNGGAGQVAIMTAKLLAENGHRVIFFASVGPVGQELENIQNLSVVCLNQKDILRDPNRLRAVFQGVWNLRAAKTFASVLSKCSTNDTIIHIHALSKSISSSIIPIAKHNGFRIVYHLHDYGIACPNLGFYDYQKGEICSRKAMSMSCVLHHCDSRSFLHKGWRVLRQFVQYYFGALPRNVDTMIYISAFSRRIIEPYLPKEQHLVFLPNLIDVKTSERIRSERNQLYLFIGRFAPEKGAELFAHAAARLSIPAVFIGAGECEDELRTICPQAEFPGWLSHEEIERYFLRARALVFPSKWYETMGLSVAEAAAHGIPAVVSDVCAACDEIVDGETGLLFRSGSRDSLCHQIGRLKDNTLTFQLSQKAYQNYWERKYDSVTYIHQLEMIYKHTLSGWYMNHTGELC